jgi:hypothetical protein
MTACKLAEAAVLSYILASHWEAWNVRARGRIDLTSSLGTSASIARAETIVAGEAAKSSNIAASGTRSAERAYTISCLRRIRRTCA